MYKILLLFSSFYSLSLSLSLHHRAATKRQEIWKEQRERTLGKNSQKPEEEKTFVEKNEWCVRLFFFFFLRELGASFLLFSLFFSSRNKLRSLFDLFLALCTLLGPSVVFEPFAGVAPPPRGRMKETTRHKH